jgi:hypothetical protein
MLFNCYWVRTDVFRLFRAIYETRFLWRKTWAVIYRVSLVRGPGDLTVKSDWSKLISLVCSEESEHSFLNVLLNFQCLNLGRFFFFSELYRILFGWNLDVESQNVVSVCILSACFFFIYISHIWWCCDCSQHNDTSLFISLEMLCFLLLIPSSLFYVFHPWI